MLSNLYSIIHKNVSSAKEVQINFGSKEFSFNYNPEISSKIFSDKKITRIEKRQSHYHYSKTLEVLFKEERIS